MYRLVLMTFLLAGSPCFLAAQEPEKKPQRAVVITNVTVIDGTDGPEQPGLTVILHEGKVQALGKQSDLKLPADALEVDGTGKFLIPGLWDMHVHLVSEDYLKLFAANGVTGIREMHAFFPDGILAMRKAVAEGKMLGPRIVAAYAIVDGPNPSWPSSLVAKDAAEGRKAVQTLKSKGADFVKVYSKLPREAYVAIADEAKKQKLPFAGHVPESVSAKEAAELGQRTMEHLYGVWNASSTEEEAMRKEVVQLQQSGKPVAGWAPTMIRNQVKAIDTTDAAKRKALIDLFAKQKTYQVPTLAILRVLAMMDKDEITKDERVKYMPIFIRQMWSPSDNRTKGLTFLVPSSRRIYAESLKVIGEMHQAGVPILAGTDCTNPYCFPGFSLHDELALLVEAGLPPKAALQSATRLPAECLGLAHECGTITVGKRADVVLLDANPLTDIHNTKKIAGVCVAGRWLERKALDEMLSKIEQANKPQK
jgi:imidazolonepropionase-like amidohydrolase